MIDSSKIVAEIKSLGDDKPWLMVAAGELGIKEVPGSGNNPKIIEYHSTTGFRAQADAVPWCSSFVNWVMRVAGYDGTGSAAANSWLTYGVPCEAKPGAIVVLSRGEPHQAHVGFVLGTDPIFVRVLGGNQGDEVNVRRFFRAKVLAYRWPSAVV